MGSLCLLSLTIHHCPLKWYYHRVGCGPALSSVSVGRGADRNKIKPITPI